jgi:hypothetical protein
MGGLTFQCLRHMATLRESVSRPRYGNAGGLETHCHASCLCGRGGAREAHPAGCGWRSLKAMLRHPGNLKPGEGWRVHKCSQLVDKQLKTYRVSKCLFVIVVCEQLSRLKPSTCPGEPIKSSRLWRQEVPHMGL